jgi:hypothetical protein
VGEGGRWGFLYATQLPENEVMSQQTKSQLSKKPTKTGYRVFGSHGWTCQEIFLANKVSAFVCKVTKLKFQPYGLSMAVGKKYKNKYMPLTSAILAVLTIFKLTPFRRYLIRSVKLSCHAH